jgi:hypothetical protein
MNGDLVHSRSANYNWNFASLSGLCGKVVHSIHINSTDYTQIGGRGIYLKRRNAFGRHVLSAANWFFRISRAPISFWTQARDWQRWEIETFSMLNAGYEARCMGAGAIAEDPLPGESLWTIAKQGELTPGMLDAAAIELRRAHGFYSGWFGGPWSHGDGAMCNVIYDARAERARLIDFELIHDRALRAAERHAEDLLSFLLDLVGVVSEEQWMPYALRYVNAYGNSRAVRQLYDVLTPPGWIARLWWRIRTNFADEGIIIPRLQELKRALVDARWPTTSLVVNARAGAGWRSRPRRWRKRRWAAGFGAGATPSTART